MGPPISVLDGIGCIETLIIVKNFAAYIICMVLE